MIHFDRHIFKNGLRILEAPMRDTKAAAVLILVGAGSRYEGSDIAGLSHFLEHMFFKGTKKRPTYLDVSMELDGLGANYNAFTSQEYTGYFIHASAERFDKSLDILADMLLEGTLPATEIAKEKTVITEELNMYWDMPQSAVAEIADKLVYGANPLGRPVIGRKETIAAVTREKLMVYKQNYYSPGNMVVAVAGNPNQFDWLDKIKFYFEALKNQKAPTYQKFKPHQKKPQFELVSRKTDQAHFVLGWRGIARTDPRRPILKMLNTVAGGMMSSRLFEEVREKRGLAYYVGSSFDEYHDTGSFCARAGVVTAKIEEAIAVTLETMRRFAKVAIANKELARAKENLKGHLYLGLENSFAVAEFLAEQELLWGKIDQPEKIVKDIENVTEEDIMELGKEILADERLNLAVIGPYDSENKFKKLLEA